MDSRIPVRRLQLAALAALTALSAPAQTAPGPESSPLQAVARELSADGIFYTYMDFEGGWAEIGRELSDTLKNSSLANSGVDIPGAFEAIGLSQIRALGMSSRTVVGGYDNRFFLYTPSGRAGFLSVFPGKPQPFQAAQFAPADADLVIDARVDIPAFIKVVESVILRFSGKKGAADLLKSLRDTKDNPMPELLKYQGRAIAIVRMHPPEQIEKNAAEHRGSLPAHFFAMIETGGEAAAKVLRADDRWQHETKNGRTYFIRKPGADTATDDIAVIIDDERLAVATRPFAEECLAKDNRLASDASYVQALTDSATEGHVLVYMTPKFFSSVRDASKWLFLAGKGFGNRSLQETLVASQLIELMPTPEKPLTSVLVARDDGILLRGHSIESLKPTLPAIALITPDFLGRIATYAARAWVIQDAHTQASELAQKEFAAQLQQVGEAAQKYFAANPEADVVTLNSLKSAMPDEKLPDFSSVSSTDLELTRASDLITLQHNTLGIIEHVMPITDAQRAAIEKTLRDIDRAALESMIADKSESVSADALFSNGLVEPPLANLLGEDFSTVSPTLTSTRLSVTTHGRQEIAIEREPKAVALARRNIAERQLHVERNLAKAHEAARRYFEMSPEESYVSFDDLANKNLKPELTPVLDENYSELSFTRDAATVVLAHPRIGRVSYTVPPAPEVIAALRSRLEKLERAASDYFAKNPKAELVIGEEIYAEPVQEPQATPNAEETIVSLAGEDSSSSLATDLTAMVIRRDYTTIKASLENGYEVSVVRTKPKR